ncbi:hypothetical protein MMC13_005124 [Lambiella insularis]|nr:hypothetical protein [Lambiella insularis]
MEYRIRIHDPLDLYAPPRRIYFCNSIYQPFTELVGIPMQDLGYRSKIPGEILTARYWLETHAENPDALAYIKTLSSIEFGEAALVVAKPVLIDVHLNAETMVFQGSWIFRTYDSSLSHTANLRVKAMTLLDPRWDLVGRGIDGNEDLYVTGDLTPIEVGELQAGIFPPTLSGIGRPGVDFGPGKIVGMPPPLVMVQQGATPALGAPHAPIQAPGGHQGNGLGQHQGGGGRQGGIGFSRLAKDNGTRFGGPNAQNTSKPPDHSGLGLEDRNAKRKAPAANKIGMSRLAKDNGTRLAPSAQAQPDDDWDSEEDEPRIPRRFPAQYGTFSARRGPDYDEEEDAPRNKPACEYRLVFIANRNLNAKSPETTVPNRELFVISSSTSKRDVPVDGMGERQKTMWMLSD